MVKVKFGKLEWVLLLILFLVTVYGMYTWDRQRRTAPVVDFTRSNVVDPYFDYFHNENEDAWIQELDNNIITVETVYTKLRLTFQVYSKYFLAFKKPPYIVPVSFHCVKDHEGGCDYKSPYLLYVKNVPAWLVSWKFLKESQPEKSAYVHHGPGDDIVDYPRAILASVKNGTQTAYMHLLAVNSDQFGKLSNIKRNDTISIVLPENEPYNAYIKGVKFTIVATQPLNFGRF